MERTLEERATAYTDKVKGTINQYHAYKQGAIDQKKVDIERLKDLLDVLKINKRDKAAILTIIEE